MSASCVMSRITRQFYFLDPDLCRYLNTLREDSCGSSLRCWMRFSTNCGCLLWRGVDTFVVVGSVSRNCPSDRDLFRGSRVYLERPRWGNKWQDANLGKRKSVTLVLW